MAKTPEHGTSGRYSAGCRCDDCRRWKADKQAAYRDRKRAKETGEPIPPKPKRPRSTGAPRSTPGATHGLSDSDIDRALDGLEEMFSAGPIEAAAREALTDPKDAATRLRHELVFRGARSLDDPKNARYFASTVEAVRRVLADLIAGGGADDAAAIMDAIRGAAGD